MQNNIFNSNITLYFKDKSIEPEYQKEHFSNRNLINKYFPPVLLIVSLTELIVTLVKKHHTEITIAQGSFYIILLVAIVLVVVDVALIVLYILWRKKTEPQVVLTYMLYIHIHLHFVVLKFIFEGLYHLPIERYYFINFLEYILRSFFHFCGIVDFLQTFGINISLLSIILIFYYTLKDFNSILFDGGVCFIILNVFLIISSYLITRVIRKNFFFMYQLNLLNSKRRTIINNLNAGYMKVKNKKIEFISQSLLEVVSNTLRSESSKNDSTTIMTTLICENDSENEVINTEVNVVLEVDQVNKVFEQVKSIWSIYINGNTNNKSSNDSDRGNYPKYVFFKYQTIGDITYEIFCRCEGKDEFEFIFNDITRVKENEKREYQLKMQNIFFTKISHEFKNPLVSIDELIDQIMEKLGNGSGVISQKGISDIKYNCNLVKSYTQYLIILIKDIDYFSDIRDDTSKSSKGVYEKVVIKELVDFCNNIAYVKMKSMNKEKKILYNSHITSDAPYEIFVDSMKLKQILTNLVTNAIKFTYKGKIFLEVSFDSKNNKVIFRVEDTGCGLNETIQHQFSNDEVNGNSLGLIVIKKLSSQIGDGLKYTTKKNKGTSFIFGISAQNAKWNDTEMTNTSIKTIKNDLNNSLHIVSPMTDDEKETLNIIFTDDEDLSRKALIRIVKSVAESKRYYVNAIEAKDGIETLYTLYEHYSKSDDKMVINGIISDQKMRFINGTSSHLVLSKYTNFINKNIPFFIVTAFDVNAKYFDGVNCLGVYTKPIRKIDAESIIEKIVKYPQ